MKHILSLSLLLAFSTQAEWSVKPAANPKAPGKGLAVAKDGKPVAHFRVWRGPEETLPARVRRKGR